MAVQDTAVQANSSRLKKFLREVKAEMKKVAWPNKKELASYTGVVFVSVILVSILIWIIDTGFTQAFRALIK